MTNFFRYFSKRFNNNWIKWWIKSGKSQFSMDNQKNERCANIMKTKLKVEAENGIGRFWQCQWNIDNIQTYEYNWGQ